MAEQFTHYGLELGITKKVKKNVDLDYSRLELAERRMYEKPKAQGGRDQTW